MVAGDDDRKQRDIASLRGQNPSYATVFDGEYPDHYTFTAGNPGKLTVQSGATAVEFDFLIWIQKSDGTNTFADPGIRNKG